MATEFVDETTVFDRFSDAIREGRQEILIASPWISRGGLSNVLSDLRPNAQISRILIRIKEQADAQINDLDTLNLLKLDGARIRYCPELHAKMLVVDNKKAIIGSSNITASGLGIKDAPNIETGVVTDENEVVGNAKQKFEDIWRNAVEYEHGDLIIKENRITFSDNGNRKLAGALLAGIGGGLLFESLTQKQTQESRPSMGIKIPEPFGIRSKVKEKAKEMVSPVSNHEYDQLQNSYWQTVPNEFITELIQNNKEFVGRMMSPKNYEQLIINPTGVLTKEQIEGFANQNSAIIDKYTPQTTQFVERNGGVIDRLKATGIGKNVHSFVDKLGITEEQKSRFLIGSGLLLMAAPALGIMIPLPPMGQRIALAAIWGQCVAIGAVLIGWGVAKKEFSRKERTVAKTA